MAANQVPPGGDSSAPARSPRCRRHTLFPMLGLLIIVTLVLGTVGFYCHWSSTGLSADVSSSRLVVEAIWRSVQLFTFESVYDESFFEKPVSWELHLARVLAAVISFTVAGGVVYAVLRDSVKRWLEARTERRRGHYVVCGLGRRSIEFVRELIRDKKRVVAIELNPQGEHILECRERGVRVLVGSATDRTLLERAGVLTAGWLIAFTGDDCTNAEIAVRARELVREKGRPENNPLSCRVHLVDPTLNQAFKQHPVYTEEGDPIDAQPFNTYENAARLLLQELLGSPHNKPHQACTHLIIHGFGPMGQAVLLQAARMGHLGPGCDFRVTLLGVSDADFFGFQAHYPATREVCHIERKADGPDHPEVREFLKRAIAEERTEAAIVVCLEDDPKSCHAALSLRESPREPVVPVYVELTSPVGLVSLFESNVADHPDLKHLRPFGQPKVTSSCDLVLQAPLDRKAKAIHHHYRTGKLVAAIAEQNNSTPEAVRAELGARITPDYIDSRLNEFPNLKSKPAMRPWDKLDEDLRESNRQAADHLPIKLRHIGCYAAAKALTDRDRPTDFTPDEIEELAQMEHTRYCAERRLARWIKGDTMDTELKTNPTLVLWDDLDDRDKKWNRDTIRAIPEWLGMVEEKIYRHHA